MTRKQKRLTVIFGGMSFIIAAVLLVMFAFSRSVAYFYMPTDVAKNPLPPDTRIRLGGLVGEGSIVRDEGSVVRFAVTDPSGEIVNVRYQGILPDLFREGQGVVTEGTFQAGSDLFSADTVLAKHDETYMPKEVADRLKAEGLWEKSKGPAPQGKVKGQEAKDAMIIEIGHYLLVLALAIAIILSVVPVIGARRHDQTMMDIAPFGSVLLFALVAFSFAALTYAHVVSDFSVENVWENSHSLVPLVYKYSGVWGNHEGSMMLWLLILSLFSALVAVFGRNLPDTLKANVLAVQAWISFAFILFILLTSNPVHSPRSGTARGPGPQSVAAGHRPRHPSAAALSRLCRLFDLFLLRGRRADGRPYRCGLGALGASLDACRLDLPDARHRDGLLLGLLRTRLGRLVVLGSGRECLLHALARRYRAAAFGARHGEARGVEDLDAAAGHPHLLAVADGHLPGALRRADLGACLCQRSEPRSVHTLHPVDLHRRGVVSICLPGTAVVCRRAVCAGLA